MSTTISISKKKIIIISIEAIQMVIDYTVRPDDMNLYFGFTPRGAIHFHNTLGAQIAYCIYVQYVNIHICIHCKT